MASLRTRNRKDGSEYFAVLYRLDGKQSSASFEDFASADTFKKLADKYGPERALLSIRTDPTLTTALTVSEWMQHHIDHLTGLKKSTLYDYRSYLRNDIGPALGDLPLKSLTRDDIALWVNAMAETGASGKTIANKHGFLSSALNAAVPKHIPFNPAAGQRLPETVKKDIVALTPEEFSRLLNEVTEYWGPLVEFLVASGARWGEATALKPGDVNRENGTVRITTAWKRTYEGGGIGYEIGVPKTKKSVRTISVSRAVLDKLNYSGEFLFENRAGRPVRGNGFHDRVWQPAVERVWPTKDAEGNALPPEKLPPRPRIHDLRHTCATWMVLAGVPLPVVQTHLGHENINTTISLYSHVDRKSADVAAEAIAAALASTSSDPVQL
jgi:integrase